MVVLDSTFLIHFLRNDQTATTLADSFTYPVCTTRINVFEVLVGIYAKPSPERENMLNVFAKFLQIITILDFDETATHTAARISADLNKKGMTVSDNDIFIAAIAITNSENTIVTRNTKDFKNIQGLTIQTY